LDAGLSRTQVIQHQSLPIETSQPTHWLFELPLFHNQSLTTVQLSIDQENNEATDNSKSWSLTIRFELDKMGVFSATAKLVDNRLDIKFNAENNDTLEFINQHISELKSSLVDGGIILGDSKAEIAATPELIRSQLSEQMLDVTI
ncbi:MAG: flagellar hook-length control protein FliK, partial [Kangiellaceae bacterium]|nr:flagellar hook-length control protein FliK [Kangiellaceae bacterium]